MKHGLRKPQSSFHLQCGNWELPAKEIAGQYYRVLQSAGQSQSKHEEKKPKRKAINILL